MLGNVVALCGRLTRDPEIKTFNNGGKVARFGLALNDKKKDKDTGEWVDDPTFVDCDAFNRGDYGKTADIIEQYLFKGSQVFIQGYLKMEKWNDQSSGQMRTKLKVVVESVKLLDSKQDSPGQQRSQPSKQQGNRQQGSRPQGNRARVQDDPPADDDGYNEPPEEDIPF